MNRRDLIKGLLVLSAVAVLPCFVFGDDRDHRTQVYMRKGDVLRNQRFVNHVTIYAEGHNVIEGGWFERGCTVVEAGCVTNTFNNAVLPRVTLSA